jgi:hypothetical protein
VQKRRHLAEERDASDSCDASSASAVRMWTHRRAPYPFCDSTMKVKTAGKPAGLPNPSMTCETHQSSGTSYRLGSYHLLWGSSCYWGVAARRWDDMGSTTLIGCRP